MKTLLVLIIAASAMSLATRAADPAALTEIRIKETAARQYLCAKKDLKISEVGDFATKAITELMEKATELKLMQGGPVMFTYFKFHGDPEQVFTLEIGIPIHADEPKDLGSFYVRKAPKFKCAAAIFQGPLSKIGESWHSFAQDAMSRGEPTDEFRELYLNWEGHDSPNNIIELETGLK